MEVVAAGAVNARKADNAIPQPAVVYPIGVTWHGNGEGVARVPKGGCPAGAQKEHHDVQNASGHAEEGQNPSHSADKAA